MSSKFTPVTPEQQFEMVEQARQKMKEAIDLLDQAYQDGSQPASWEACAIICAIPMVRRAWHSLDFFEHRRQRGKQVELQGSDVIETT